eukprot:SAG11_NODE_426_length_9563_cov_7.501479_3_plen_89_part_00
MYGCPLRSGIYGTVGSAIALKVTFSGRAPRRGLRAAGAAAGSVRVHMHDHAMMQPLVQAYYVYSCSCMRPWPMRSCSRALQLQLQLLL